MFTEKENEDRNKIADHILKLREKDIELAREALRWYHNNQPWLEIKELVKQRITDGYVN
jgi:GH35 family endo-1,4-beta-xylanase